MSLGWGVGGTYVGSAAGGNWSANGHPQIADR